VRQIVDESDAVTLARTYKPLGGILQEQGPYETVFGFLDAQLDRISGLLYAGGQYYDPATGRFLTPQRRSWDPYHPRSLNPYVPWVDFSLLLLAPLMILSGATGKGRRRRKYTRWWLLTMMVVGATGVLVACEDKPQLTLPPLPDTPVLPVPWMDEMAPENWDRFPNSCGAMALYMFLQAEHKQVDLSTLVQQLAAERPGGHDGYCCSDGWGRFPTPTPDPAPEPWCNPACVSAEALADVARKYYGMAIESGDGWTRERVHAKLSQGHPVLALIRVDLRIHPPGRGDGAFGHFVVIRGLVDQGATVVFNDSYPGEQYWDERGGPSRADERQAAGEGRREDWHKFDRSWASYVDKDKDPLAPEGHVRWAMAAQ